MSVSAKNQEKMAPSLSHSLSLTSNSHPLISQFNDHLTRLGAFKEISSSFLSISNKLSGLEDLYSCVDDLLLLPHTQHSFVKESREKWVDTVLDGHVRLLDACVRAKDVLSHSRTDIQQLLNVLRRREEEGYDFGKYLAARKMAKRTAKKSLSELRDTKNKPFLLALDKDQETVAVISKLNEAEAATQTVIERLLAYIAETKVPKRTAKWSMVSKIILNKRLTGREENRGVIRMNEFKEVDVELRLLVVHKTCANNMQMHLGKMESNIQCLEGGLQSLFQHLIRTRVSLLNVLNH